MKWTYLNPPISTLSPRVTPKVAASGFAALTFGALVTDRVLGLVFIVLVSARYGTSREMDAYLLAVAFPTIAANLVGDVLYSSLVPAIVRSALPARTIWSILIWIVLGLSLLTAAYCLSAVIAARIYSGDGTGHQGLLASLSILAAPVILLGGSSSAMASVLISRGHYAPAALRIPLATAIAACSFAVVRVASTSIEAVLFSVLLGAAASVVSMFVAVIRVIGPPTVTSANLRLGGRELQQIRWASLAQLAVGIAGQGSVIVERAAGFGLGAGVVSAINYGRTLVSPPLLFGQSVATGTYPKMIKLAAGPSSEAREFLAASLAMVVFVMLPTTILLVELARPLVTFVFQHGAFSVTATAATALAASLLSLGLIPISAGAVLTRFLYATRHPARAAVASWTSLATYVGLALILRSRYGLPGLALASVLSSLVLTVLFLAAVPESMLLLRSPAFARSTSIVCLSAIGMGCVLLVVGSMHHFMGFAPNAGPRIILSATLAAVVYLGFCHIFGSPELKKVVALARQFRHG